MTTITTAPSYVDRWGWRHPTTTGSTARVWRPTLDPLTQPLHASPMRPAPMREEGADP